MPPHNLPLAVSPHPDIREAKFSAERFAIVVFACFMVASIANRQVLAVHLRFKGHKSRTGNRAALIRYVSEPGSLIGNDTAGDGVGKVVGPDSLQVIKIFVGKNLAPLFRELCDFFRYLFSFVSRHRRLRWASGNTSRQGCAHSNEYHQ